MLEFSCRGSIYTYQKRLNCACITKIFLNLCGCFILHYIVIFSKTCVKRPLSIRLKIGFQDHLSLYAGQKYCIMLHSAILLTFIKLPFVIKIFFIYFRHILGSYRMGIFLGVAKIYNIFGGMPGIPDLFGGKL